MEVVSAQSSIEVISCTPTADTVYKIVIFVILSVLSIVWYLFYAYGFVNIHKALTELSFELLIKTPSTPQEVDGVFEFMKHYCICSAALSNFSIPLFSIVVVTFFAD